MESEQKKKGRPSEWDASLTKVCQSGTQFPKEIWELLRCQKTKKVLNRMALDKDYKLKIWQSVEEEIKANRESDPP